jgi:murein DD-endopeptidase MepM/ murein hydrolase activator NlpD
MAHRHWTVVIVPHGSDSPRSLQISQTMVRALQWSAGVAATIVLTAALLLTVSIARGGLLAAVGLDAKDHAAATMRTRVTVLQDTIASLERRNDQMRLFAGLPTTDSAGTTPPSTSDTRTDVDGLIRRANDLSASFTEVTGHLYKDIERLSNTPSIMPTTGWLSSEFSRARFHPILHLTRPHEGIDLAAPYGTPVVAPAAGVVERVTVQTGYGNVLEIDHGNGVETKYAHLSRIDVRVGQHVTRGQPIAAVGNSGLSTGPHLHYEVHVNGKVVDPLTYVLPGAIPD